MICLLNKSICSLLFLVCEDANFASHNAGRLIVFLLVGPCVMMANFSSQLVT